MIGLDRERGRKVTYKGEAVAIETEVRRYSSKICTKHVTAFNSKVCSQARTLICKLHKMPAGTAASEHTIPKGQP